jgi:hypothetical protein
VRVTQSVRIYDQNRGPVATNATHASTLIHDSSPDAAVAMKVPLSKIPVDQAECTVSSLTCSLPPHVVPAYPLLPQQHCGTRCNPFVWPCPQRRKSARMTLHYMMLPDARHCMGVRMFSGSSSLFQPRLNIYPASYFLPTTAPVSRSVSPRALVAGLFILARSNPFMQALLTPVADTASHATCCVVVLA